MNTKQQFIELYNTHITREGADKFLEYLMSTSSDFFSAPEHSVNVYRCLKSYLERADKEFSLHFSEESIALVSLLHDVCKINCYKPGFRNVKDDNGVWQKVPTFEFEDKLPYGHGEKSVYILSGYMRLTREEAFAIRYHMGFSGTEDARNVGNAFEQFPLAFALSVADMEATFLVEGK